MGRHRAALLSQAEPDPPASARPAAEARSGVTHPSGRGAAPRVLLVDDDLRHLRELEALLASRGYAVRRAATWDAALAAVTDRQVELILLEIAMPGLDGYALCRELRQRSGIPIIVLSRIGAEREKVHALDLGADDFLTKPVGAEELLARMRALLRRTAPATPTAEVLQVGSLTINLSERRVLRDGDPVQLTPTEFGLLVLLARNAGKALTHTALLQRVWGPEYGDERDYLWAYIRRLRQKLEGDPRHPRYLLSEPGVGYRLSVPDDGPGPA